MFLVFYVFHGSNLIHLISWNPNHLLAIFLGIPYTKVPIFAWIFKLTKFPLLDMLILLKMNFFFENLLLLHLILLPILIFPLLLFFQCPRPHSVLYNIQLLNRQLSILFFPLLYLMVGHFAIWMLIMLFCMVPYLKRVLCNNHQVLLIKPNPPLCGNFKKLYMVLNKIHQHGILNSRDSYSPMVFLTFCSDTSLFIYLSFSYYNILFLSVRW